MSCSCVLGSGPNKGKRCTNKAHGNGFCGVHKNCKDSFGELSSPRLQQPVIGPRIPPPELPKPRLHPPIIVPRLHPPIIVPTLHKVNLNTIPSPSATSSKLGMIYIQSKVPPRQSGDLYPGDKCGARSKIDVTSGQKIGHPDRVAFSPMTEVPNGYMGFHCFENFWQSGKRYKEMGHMNYNTKLDDIGRWKAYSEPHRRHPKAKGMVPVDAIYPDIGITEGIDYVTSRKQVYVPYYYNEIISKDRFQYWRSQVAAGNDILIIDYDGPKVPHGNYYSRPCLVVTLDLLVEKINDTRYPFGHGYVVAAALLGIDPDQYTS
jgi:hypothetical protein